MFSVFSYSQPCTSPPVTEAHPGKGICATPRFIVVPLKPLLKLQQHLSLENTSWAPSPKMPCVPQARSFSEKSVLKLSGLKRSCLSYSRPLISHLFPKKMDPLWKRRHREHLQTSCQLCTTRNGNPCWQLCTTGQANAVQYELEKWVCNCSGHLTFPLYCYELKSGNSALNSTYGSVFFFVIWIFQSCYSKVGQVLVCKIHNFYLFTSGNHG